MAAAPKKRTPANLRIKSDNGDLFIVTKDGKELALGLVVRGGKKVGKLAYFFPMKIYWDVENKADLQLHHNQAIWAYAISSLSIEDGSWPLVGKLKNYTLDRWPMPLFWRKNGYNEQYIVQYDEKDIAVSLNTWPLNDVPRDVDVSFVIEDGLAGCGYVEDYIEDILNGEHPAMPWINVKAKKFH